LLATFTMSCVFGFTGTFEGSWYGMGLLIAGMSAINVAAFAVLLAGFARQFRSGPDGSGKRRIPLTRSARN